MSAPLWDISVEDDGTTIVVRPVGEIDSYTAAQVDAHLRGGGNGHTAIVLDVSQVEFMDSTGLTMLIHAHRREPERFALRGNSPAVERLLELSGTSRLFTRADAVDGAGD